MKRKREESTKEIPKPKRVKTILNGIWVSNLPPLITIDELKEYVCEIGTIEKVVILKNRIKMEESNTFAAVLFEGKIADDALDYNGASVQDYEIGIRFLKSSDLSVRLKGVKIEIDKLKKIIEGDVGEIENVRKIKEDEYSIFLKSFEGVDKILLFHGSRIDGLVVEISYPSFNVVKL